MAQDQPTISGCDLHLIVFKAQLKLQFLHWLEGKGKELVYVQTKMLICLRQLCLVFDRVDRDTDVFKYQDFPIQIDFD